MSSNDGTPAVKRDIEKAKAGDAEAAHRVGTADDVKPAATEAAEQEAADGPEGRGLSR